MEKLVKQELNGAFHVLGVDVTTCNAAMYACILKLQNYEATDLSPESVELLKQMYDNLTRREPVYRVSVEELMGLTNKVKREIFLNKWHLWPVFARVPALNLEVRRIDFPDGTCFTVSNFNVGIRCPYPRFQIHHGDAFAYNACFEMGTSSLADKLMRMRMDMVDKEVR